MQSEPALDQVVDAARHGFSVSGDQLLVGSVAALVCLVCVAFHYEVMSLSFRLIPRFVHVRRVRIVMLILAMSMAHGIEVWIFGLTYWGLDFWPELGRLGGDLNEGALDFVYFSVTTYTTLGFGDMVPVGPIRILCGSEALLGLILITWTASGAFLEMQRDWGELPRSV